MTNLNLLECDGCGQTADTQHIARRLERLEWTTRYRPVHIHTLFLSGVSPQEDTEFLYAPNGEFVGEGRRLLEVAGITFAGKTRDAVQMEFQRAGFFLAHVLECPVNQPSQPGMKLAAIVEKRAPAVAARIRRSLKPRRLALISQLLAPLAEKFSTRQLECPVVLDGEQPFALDGSDFAQAMTRLSASLAAAPPR